MHATSRVRILGAPEEEGRAGRKESRYQCWYRKKRSDDRCSITYISSILFLPCQRSDLPHAEITISPVITVLSSVFFFFSFYFPIFFRPRHLLPKKGRRCGYDGSHHTYSPTRSAVGKGMLSSLLPPLVRNRARNRTFVYTSQSPDDKF